MVQLPRRNPDGTFDSAADAYEFSVTVLQIRRGAKCLKYNPDRIASAKQHGEYQVLDAIQILTAIERNDLSNGRISWFADYFLPIPTIPAVPFTAHQVSKLMRHVHQFECELAHLRFLPHCGNRKCRKRLTIKKR